MAVRMSEREKLQSRLEAAQINGGAAAAVPRGNDRYAVEGRAGGRYTVWAIGDRYLCDCRAGQYGNACWHAASVYLRVIAERSVAA